MEIVEIEEKAEDKKAGQKRIKPIPAGISKK